jgi:uncharacterized protein
MKLSMERPGGIHLVRGYSAEGLRIDDQLYRNSVIVSATDVIGNWRPRNVDELGPEDLRAALELAPEVLLLGTGPTQRFPAAPLYDALYRSRVGFEIMDTGAACRTYNVLVGEGRAVVAALLFS